MGGSMSAHRIAVLDRIAVAVFIVAWTVMLICIAPGIISERQWIAILLGIAGGYLLADFLAGSVHWIADRFFDPKTPVLGPMLIAPSAAN